MNAHTLRITPMLLALALGAMVGCAPGVSGPKTCAESNQICATRYQPVCGKDGNTYSNACTAAQACMPIKHPGVCK